MTPDGRHQYLQHAKKADKLIDAIADRFHFPNDVTKKLQFAAANHMKMHDLLKMSNSKIAKLMDDDAFDVLVAVAEADAKARGKMFNSDEWTQILNKIAAVADKYEGKKAIDTIKKVVNGRWVMELRNLKGGPEVGRIINTTVEWILDNNVDLTDLKKIEDYIRNEA